MEGHAQKCVERCCEPANKKPQQLHTVSTPCLHDHSFKKEELETVGELSEVCPSRVLKCLYLPRIGRPDILWSVNRLARGVTKWTGACDRRSARLFFFTFVTQTVIDNIVMWATLLSLVDCVCSKTQTLLATSGTQNQPQVVSCVFLEVEQLSPSVGCARSKHQCSTVLQNRNLFHWMLVCEWTVSLLLICGMW